MHRNTAKETTVAFQVAKRVSRMEKSAFVDAAMAFAIDKVVPVDKSVLNAIFSALHDQASSAKADTEAMDAIFRPRSRDDISVIVETRKRRDGAVDQILAITNAFNALHVKKTDCIRSLKGIAEAIAPPRLTN